MIGIQILFNGIIAGSMYALLASGFALIYVTNRFIHLAHGGVAAVGAYVLYACFALLGLNFYVSVVMAVIATSVLGVLLFGAVYHPLIKRKSSSVIMLIASLGLLILLNNSLLLIFGSDVKLIDHIPVAKGLTIAGAVITPLQLLIVMISLFLLIFLWLFVWYTKTGKIIRAVADHAELASTTGINITRVQYLGFLVGSAMAGVAGVLIALEQNAEPYMGVTLIVKGFTGAIIGGATSIPGAVLGSYFLGIVENAGIWYLPSGYKDAIAFMLLLLFLLLRPQGILGVHKGIRQ